MNGITLIALVVTIVVLLILAGITISLVFSENGIIAKARETKKIWEEAAKNEVDNIDKLGNELDEILGEYYEKGEIILKDIMPKNINEAKELGTVFEEKITLLDDLNNSIIIPPGFKVAEDSGATVGEGIVIEDVMAGDGTSNGNQFVWIPVGEYTNSSGKQKNNLARRNFTSNGATEIECANAMSLSGMELQIENENEEYIVEKVKHDINNFKDSANQNGGFYIARYEAGGYGVCTISKANHETCGDMIWKNDSGYEINKSIEKATINIYKDNPIVESCIVNTYARDTTINFMCQNSSKGYELAVATDIAKSEKGLTGTNPKDCFSNIYDMAGNVNELLIDEGLIAGGDYKNANIAMSNEEMRYWVYDKPLSYYDNYGFRFMIYLQ